MQNLVVLCHTVSVGRSPKN